MQISISHPTIDALVEVITGGGAYTDTPTIGMYRKGFQIESFFRSCGAPITISGRSRCPAVRETLLELVAQGNEKVLRTIIERSADPRDFIDDPAKLQAVIDYLNLRLTLDGLELRRQGPAVRLVNASTSAAVLESLASATHALDLDTVRTDLDRALASAETDPEDAVTAACSIVESVCKSVLAELGLPLPAVKDVQHLFKAVQEPLGLSPARKDLPDEISVDVKMVLQGLASMVQGIGALRTHGGDAHGREKGFKRIDARIARLAIHSASCAAVFIIETWQQKRPKGDVPSAS
jgi:hypothetical protein